MSRTAPIVRTLRELRTLTGGWHRAGARIGVVPTMGALHAGHLSLVEAARTAADRVIVTIFVNPKQFNNPDDLAKYPRSEETDARLLGPHGVDAIYAPPPDQIYPPGFATTVSVAGLSEGLCGAHRPGHFDGVATVCAKLFAQTAADAAFFGEKDYQQLQIVTRMARDLDIPVEVVGGPLIREGDGLAMSSRNAYLSSSERAQAPALHRAIQECARQVALGTPIGAAEEQARSVVRQAGFAKVDYVTVRDAETLAEAPPASRPRRVLAAAWLGATRLIDNVPVPEEPEVPPGDEALGG